MHSTVSSPASAISLTALAAVSAALLALPAAPDARADGASQPGWSIRNLGETLHLSAHPAPQTPARDTPQHSAAPVAHHWSYTGHEGPEHWGELDPAWSACASGANQSPVDVQSSVDADLPPLAIDYKTMGTEILNNGHTVQVDVAPGSTLTLDGIPFELKQFHFHSPSEDLIDSESFGLEAHLVHAAADGHLAVIGVLYRVGSENPAVAQVWRAMPKDAGTRVPLPTPIDPAALLPKGGDYFRFSGSLTTPPCTEGVRWVLMKEPLAVSEAQVAAFREVVHGANARPVQALNARLILR